MTEPAICLVLFYQKLHGKGRATVTQYRPWGNLKGLTSLVCMPNMSLVIDGSNHMVKVKGFATDRQSQVFTSIHKQVKP